MRRTPLLLACLPVLVAGCGGGDGLERYSVPNSSMEPTVLRGDRIGCSREVPDVPRRGMVVVFSGDGTNFAASPGLAFVKRVVGLPGDRVESADGRVVTVNGQPLAEPYLSGADQPTPFEEAVVPAGQYFVLGDNRDGSSDSRFNGPIPHAALCGVCTRILAPESRKGPIAGT